MPSMRTRLEAAHAARLRRHLDVLYTPEDARVAHERLVRLLERFLAEHPAPPAPAALFDERDTILITYADQIRDEGEPPLRTLRDFLLANVTGAITGVHLLPFYPWSSDDGFAVKDYFEVDPAVGTWEDVSLLAKDFRLMVDAVFNHMSASSAWFTRWQAGDPELAGFFHDVAPKADVSSVTRPRASSLLVPVETADGQRHVWCTFSADQVDLNFANPAVLVAVTEALLAYIAAGASIIRLDAVAFLWKELGTSCVHLPKTHEIVRLWRSVIEAVSPSTLLITETNVPHQENVSYFGEGTDEAHLVYQFPLAPLVLSAFHLADASVLQDWAGTLSTPSTGTAFFNFLGSHDGIGLRPVEGLLTRAEIEQLCALVRDQGGGVSYRAQPDGTLSPYELNSVFFDALTPLQSVESRRVQVDRFLAAQSVLLAMAGVPGIYVQALLGSRNWRAGVEETGNLRSINRRKFERAALKAELADPESLRHEVFNRFLDRIRRRTSEPAFHPNGAQRILAGNRAVLAFERTSIDQTRTVLCLHNLSGRPQRYAAAAADGLTLSGALRDIVSGRPAGTADGGVDVSLEPYGVAWLLSEG
jgi:glucosylglycerate phosphorylase